MTILTTYITIWSLIEPLLAAATLLLSGYIFLADPIRRWKFFGYRPTVMAILFDPKLKKVLLVKSIEWGFPQGSVYNSDIFAVVDETLERELTLKSNRYKLYYVEPLGASRILSRGHAKKAALGTISLFPNIRGKGYIGCFLETDLTALRRVTKLGQGVTAMKIVSIPAAEKILLNALFDNPGKAAIYLKITALLPRLFVPVGRRPV